MPRIDHLSVARSSDGAPQARSTEARCAEDALDDAPEAPVSDGPIALRADTSQVFSNDAQSKAA